MLLVTGASGNVGAELVSQLTAAGVPVRALVRRQDASLPDEVQRAVGDLNQPDSVAAALTSGQHNGQTYRLSGPESLQPAEQVRALGAVLGRDLRLQAQSDEQARREMSASMPAEYVRAFFSFYVDGTLDESEVLPTVEKVTGKPPRTFEQWARLHADAFR
ncbi:MAG TPA: NAD(P)H-binding protein [Actinomycetota bacterium]|jgi:uncharacterized protein YbjT (DUF2867 family)|nr:NAD(P)H-binding protein [Actinomycetota bacterium]